MNRNKKLLTLPTLILAAGIQLTSQAADPGLKITKFAGPDMSPCPATICAAPTGEVYVGVDTQGSLGKEEGHGSIVKLIDTDNDGVADKHTVFAKLDNPRGVISVGKKVYVLHNTFANGKVENQHLSVLVDEDQDGVADGPPKFLVRNIGNPPHLQGRGTDHSTNGIRLAIDGWIYISIGDFGFIDATGTDGSKLSMLGGGVVRVRPDGTGLETFIHGTRNVYDVAIDPFMNVYSRENTNDGVGWWIRFSHYVQSGEYGYPALYTNFAHDMLPALSEHGGGSGTGALYLQEPSWPAPYNNQPLMADWGRRKVIIHEVTPNGATFTDVPKDFLGVGQVSDLDVDGSGRMYVADWQGAGYKGNKSKGLVHRVVPEGWKYVPYTSVAKAKDQELIKLMASASAVARVDAQQEILRRGTTSFLRSLNSLALDKSALLEGRVAAIYTLSQLGGVDSLTILEELSKDEAIREHAIRCMADQKHIAAKANVKLVSKALQDSNPRVQVAAAVALGRMGKLEAANALLEVASPVAQKKKSSKTPGSKVLKLPREFATIDIDVSKFKSLFLVVHPGEKNGKDHAAWLQPTLHTTDGKTIDLTTQKYKVIKEGDGRRKTRLNKSVENKPLLDLTKKEVKGIGTHAFSIIEFELPANAARFTATGRLTEGAKGGGASVTFHVLDSIDEIQPTGKDHSTPRPAGILPHVARQSLVSLNAEEAALKAVKSNNPKLVAAALDTLKWMHSDNVVKGLIQIAKDAKDPAFKQQVTDCLIRLHHKEKDYDGKSWWSTRPDPSGPIYYPTPWSATETISTYLKEYLDSADQATKDQTIAEMQSCKAYIKGLVEPKAKGRQQEKIKDISIENIVLRVSTPKTKGYKRGNPKNGKQYLTKAGCIACHNTEPGQPIKGPDLTNLGSRTKAELVESIITPGTSIAESWVTITTKEGASHMGTLVRQDDLKVVVHDIAGIAKEIDANQVKKIGPGLNTMPYHLCDELTLQEFADLVAYIQSLDLVGKSL